jgi:DNA polymerase-3 subunit alpha
MEALSQAGAFDNFTGIRREHFFHENTAGETFTEVLLRFGNKVQFDKLMSQHSLFGGSNAIAITRPEIPQVEDWGIFEKLNREKELIGMYLSAHPLDPFHLEMKYLTNTQVNDFREAMPEGKEFSIAGLVTAARDAISKNGNPWGSLTLEDFSGSFEFRFFGKDHEKFKPYLTKGLPLFIKGNIQRNNRGELEPKIRSITYLSNVREETLKNVSIKLPLHHITDVWVNELNIHTEANKGDTTLHFKIVDPETNQIVEMFSRKQRVSLSKEFVDFLESLDVEFRVN